MRTFFEEWQPLFEVTGEAGNSAVVTAELLSGGSSAGAIEYFLDFINVEELGVRDAADIDERVVEQAIVNNVKNFIMTFG